MEKYGQVRKRLIIGLIVLSLSMTLIPIVGSLSIEKEKPMMINCSDGIVVSGTMGENGWYVSNVQVTFNSSYPPAPWFYRINGGGWSEYTTPILIDLDGIFLLEGTSDMEHIYFVLVKIDHTLPEIILMKNVTGLNKMNFIANVYDATSNVWRVEFYIDDEPVFTDFDFPFESPWVWSGDHTVVVTVFDFAGNSEIAVMSTPYVLGSVGMNFNPTETSTTTINRFQESLNERECSSLGQNITVTFTYPENAIYWNDRKIMPYSVPFILHGNGDLGFHGFRFYRDTPIEYTITGPIVGVEFYLEGVLIGSVTTAPYEFEFPILMTSFSHITVKIIAYGGSQGDWGSDEITIWRLFV